MPPTWGAAIAVCIVLLCMSPIFFPETREIITAMVTIPIPPICIRVRITAWPKTTNTKSIVHYQSGDARSRYRSKQRITERR